MMNEDIEVIEGTYSDWVTAGRIASEVREYSKTIIKPGVRLLDVAEKIEAKIRELGAEPAFPVNLSHDSFAAHCTPAPDDATVLSNQLLKVDIGVSYNGAIGDTAYTFDLSGKYAKLVEASQKAVENAVRIIKPGVTLCEIGRVIEDTITSYGFQPIRNLSGHGLGLYKIHTKPTIPNYDNGDHAMLEKGMIIAIEPFATTGGGKIREGSYPNIFMQIDEKPVRDQFTRKVFEEIKEFKCLPFSIRDIRTQPLARVKFGIRQLVLNGNLQEYPPLPETSSGMVSQHEHTILIDDEAIVLTK